MTKEEKHLWYDFLRTLSIPFYRQKTIERYIVDFYCPQANLVIELDGSQHYEDDAKAKDNVRDDFLKDRGLTVLRYSNLDINTQFRSVCEDILKHITLHLSLEG